MYVASVYIYIYIQFTQNTVPVFVGSCIMVIVKIK